jgi:hypothetical protein
MYIVPGLLEIAHASRIDVPPARRRKCPLFHLLVPRIINFAPRIFFSFREKTEVPALSSSRAANYYFAPRIFFSFREKTKVSALSSSRAANYYFAPRIFFSFREKTKVPALSSSRAANYYFAPRIFFSFREKTKVKIPIDNLTRYV